MTYSVHEHITLKRVSSIAASPDGSWLTVAVQRLDRDGVKYVSDLWKVPTDGSPATQLTRGDTQDTAPRFRHDGALGFLSNRPPNECKPDEDADKRMRVWILPAGGGEPQQLTDEPLGVEAFQFAKSAARLVLFAPVLPHVAHDKQRETAAEHAKKGPSARRYTRQPVRHWDHWLHENVDLPNMHVIAYAADGTHRVDLTPAAQREFAIEPQLDVSADGTLVAATRHTPGADRELDTTILNPRGSTGFGQAFIQGIWGNVWGDQCYKDLMCVTDALERRADVDPQRLTAMGGSFGGYMTNWIETQTDRFRCLITHASICTMAQFTGVTDHPAWWYLEMGGEDPYADPVRFERYAPVRYIKQWKTPTLIIHGERDYRCPISEGLNLFEALQYHKVPSELLVFPDENHWILKPKNVVVWYEAVLDFLARHMA
jgi:dipeptidyl aminopeptidase/acylaminoacyl peptidase